MKRNPIVGKTTKHTYKGVKFETFMEESEASGLSYWKAWALGLGSLASVGGYGNEEFSKAKAIAKAKALIDQMPNAAVQQQAYMNDPRNKPVKKNPANRYPLTSTLKASLRHVLASPERRSGDHRIAMNALHYTQGFTIGQLQVFRRMADLYKGRSIAQVYGVHPTMRRRNPTSFKEGDLVRHTAAFRRSVSMYKGNVDGVVIGHLTGSMSHFPIVAWSGGSVSPINPVNLEHKKSSTYTPALQASALTEGKRKYAAKLAKEAAEEAAYWASDAGRAARAKLDRKNPGKRSPLRKRVSR